ncbi:MAG: hypothetical protein JWN72_1871 [Thermoleophilia bacterium]|nr:hypothetical protein [Thermoleophilia bacterium]
MVAPSNINKLGTLLHAKAGLDKLPALKWASNLNHVFGADATKVGKQAAHLHQATGLEGGVALDYVSRIARRHGVAAAKGVEQLGVRVFQRTNASAIDSIQLVHQLAMNHGAAGTKVVVNNAIRMTRTTEADLKLAVKTAERFLD